jgi:hypothetical protein
MQNLKLEPTGQATPGKAYNLVGTGLVMARKEMAGWIFGPVWNPTDLFLRSKPGPLEGYQNLLLTILVWVSASSFSEFTCRFISRCTIDSSSRTLVNTPGDLCL